jgi:hypothetical protein
MKILKKRYLLSCLTVFLLAACQNSSSGGGGEQLSEPPVQPEPGPSKVNPLTANSWCRAEDWDTFQMVMRMTFQGEKLLVQNLLLNANGFNVYEYANKMNWEIRGAMAPVPGKMSVTMHETDQVIQALPGFATQKQIVTEVFSQNPNLSHPEGEFNPPRALSIVTRSVTSGEEIVRRVYPCEYYSSTFYKDGPHRPLMELLLLLGSESTNYTEKDHGHLAATMPFAFPIEEVAIDASLVANTQWCAWREVSMSEVFLRSLTIGTTEMMENAHSQIFTNYFDDAEMLAYLKSNAAKSERYQVTLNSGKLLARNLTPADRGTTKFPQQAMFSMVKDAHGAHALVRMDHREPDRTWPVFTDIYFSCQDQRPLQFNEPFRVRLPDILNLQVEQLRGF